MINLIEFKKWWAGEKSDEFKLLSINYDPKSKKKYLSQRMFDFSIVISDCDKFRDILVDYCEDNSLNSFDISLGKERFSWLPSFFEENEKNKIKIYLDEMNLDEKNYTGTIKTQNLRTFLNYYFAVPSKYQYQDVIINCITHDMIILLTHHPEIHLCTKNIELLKKAEYFFNERGATVLKNYS